MSGFVDILAITSTVLCPSLVLLALLVAAYRVLKGVGHASGGLLAIAPDWALWARTHKGYLERQGEHLSLRCTLQGQHVEVALPDRGGVVRAQLTLDPPPRWILGPLPEGVVLGPDWIQLSAHRAPVRWDHACRIALHRRVDRVLEDVEQICAALAVLQGRLDQDRQDLMEHPSLADSVSLGPRGWTVELAMVASGAWSIQGGPGGGLGVSVVDLLLHTQGSPPPPLKDPELASTLLWLLHGHDGVLNERHLRVTLAPGELREGLQRAAQVRAAVQAHATGE